MWVCVVGPADVLGAIGGFWSYVLAIFTLVRHPGSTQSKIISSLTFHGVLVPQIFVTNERGKRKPHWILRRQTWVRLGRNTQRL